MFVTSLKEPHIFRLYGYCFGSKQVEELCACGIDYLVTNITAGKNCIIPDNTIKLKLSNPGLVKTASGAPLKYLQSLETCNGDIRHIIDSSSATIQVLKLICCPVEVANAFIMAPLHTLVLSQISAPLDAFLLNAIPYMKDRCVIDIWSDYCRVV